MAEINIMITKDQEPGVMLENVNEMTVFIDDDSDNMLSDKSKIEFSSHPEEDLTIISISHMGFIWMGTFSQLLTDIGLI